ncbi:methylated-DNA--[protein]-cysteine S-methyltransferase [Rhizobium leguminosarum]|jgi:O-6-methylguanine DNA methyltransferase|uniref:methylated-DNA--[protein]-cysteine S-methyltransferase n=1 Tax=Rhizobium leguminosarum TaxID=384 RepID=UPI002E1161E0|nr:methylated-DNA--[protein]-cysteine S-methyltransferase [Rhizobium leguminosarum]
MGYDANEYWATSTETVVGCIALAGIGTTVVECLIAPSTLEARRLMEARRPRHCWNSNAAEAGAIAPVLPNTDEKIDVLLEGTSFQIAVWEALRRVPYGEVRTYGEVAASIGRPGAYRAVANACAANRIALLVPCHRVVPTAGGTGGYAWGAEAKRALLDMERERRQ